MVAVQTVNLLASKVSGGSTPSPPTTLARILQHLRVKEGKNERGRKKKVHGKDLREGR